MEFIQSMLGICTSGKWRNYGMPFADAMVYYLLHVTKCAHYSFEAIKNLVVVSQQSHLSFCILSLSPSGKQYFLQALLLCLYRSISNNFEHSPIEFCTFQC